MWTIILYSILGFVYLGDVCSAEIYKWTDKNGVSHFSDKKPAGFKDTKTKEPVKEHTTMADSNNIFNEKVMLLTNTQRLSIFSIIVNSTNTGRGCEPITASFQGIG